MRENALMLPPLTTDALQRIPLKGKPSRYANSTFTKDIGLGNTPL